MLIQEFYAKLISVQERSNVFAAMRRLSRLERPAISMDETAGWPEWPLVISPHP